MASARSGLGTAHRRGESPKLVRKLRRHRRSSQASAACERAQMRAPWRGTSRRPRSAVRRDSAPRARQSVRPRHCCDRPQIGGRRARPCARGSSGRRRGRLAKRRRESADRRLKRHRRAPASRRLDNRALGSACFVEKRRPGGHIVVPFDERRRGPEPADCRWNRATTRGREPANCGRRSAAAGRHRRVSSAQPARWISPTAESGKSAR